MADAKAEDLTPTPTQAENDAAMTAAAGASAPTPPPASNRDEKREHAPEQHRPAEHARRS